MDILINAANILYVVAYFTMDMLRLRVMTLTAASCLAVYFYNQPTPMLNVVAWNVFFILLNLLYLGRILLSRYREAKVPRRIPSMPLADTAPDRHGNLPLQRMDLSPAQCGRTVLQETQTLQGPR